MCSDNKAVIDINLNRLKTEKYVCRNCGNNFKGLGERIFCPYCKSEYNKN